jgi:Flp pilus assembly protein TadD
MASAESLYRKTIQLDPTQWIAQNNLAMILYRRGDLPNALTCAGEAAKLQPKVASVQDTLAQISAKAGDPRSAASHVKMAIELQPDNATWRIRLAQYLMDSGDTSGAKNALGAMDAARLQTDRLDPADRQLLSALRGQLKVAGH